MVWSGKFGRPRVKIVEKLEIGQSVGVLGSKHFLGVVKEIAAVGKECTGMHSR